MITIYKNLVKNTYEHETQITDNNWIRVINPDQMDLNTLHRTLNIPMDFMKEAIDINTRPTIMSEGDMMLFIIHLPYVNPEFKANSEGIRYQIIPLGIALVGTHIVTICNVDMTSFFEAFMKCCNGLGREKQIQNLLDLFHITSERYLKLMHTIEYEIAEAEDELSRSYRNSELYTLLYINDGLLDMTISLKQMLHLMRKINKERLLDLFPNAEERFEDTIIELEQAYSVAEINQLNANNVMDAYGNIIQNNVSHVVKLLTALTIVLSIPTVIATIYGMNVPLPFQESEHAFAILIVIMVILTGVVAGIFYKKKYF